jgi:hypothetical protein
MRLRKQPYLLNNPICWADYSGDRGSHPAVARVNHLAVAVGAIGVAICTLWAFAGLAYVSVVSYGVPASAFVLLGYVAWRVLAARRSAFAEPFLLAFAMPVLFVLAPMVFSVPLVVAVIIGPAALAELVRRRPWSARVA